MDVLIRMAAVVIVLTLNILMVGMISSTIGWVSLIGMILMGAELLVVLFFVLLFQEAKDDER